MKFLIFTIAIVAGCQQDTSPPLEYFIFYKDRIVCLKGTSSEVLILEVDYRAKRLPYRVLFPSSGKIVWLNQSTLMRCEND